MLKALSLFYDTYKSTINIVMIVGLAITLGTCVLKQKYNEGIREGKVAARVEEVDITTKEVRKNITEAVVIVKKTFDTRVEELKQQEQNNVLPELTDPVLIEKYENPENGISQEMFDSINKARLETNP
jgi:hypothetical protein